MMKKLILLLCMGMFLISFTSANVITSTILNTFSNTTNSSDTNTSSWIDWDNSLVGYWSMGDSYNATGIFDNSSNDNFGSFAGGIGETNLTDGMFGDALEFDGVGDYVSVGDNDNYYGSTGFTWSLWFKENEPNSGEVHDILVKWSASPNGVYVLLYNNQIQSYSGSGGTPVASTSFIPTAGQWYYLTLVGNSTNFYLYINGTEVATGTSNINLATNNNNLSIGYNSRDITTLQRFWNGSIDEVLIFNRSLSQSEISALYDSKVNKFNITIPNQEGTHTYKLYTIGGNGNLTTIDITETTDRIYNKNIYLDSANNWTSSLTQPSWDYSSNLDFKILNESKHTIFKLDEDGNLAIAGNLYENTNSPPPSANILWSFNNLFWLDDFGNFYINKLYEMIT